jgi:3-methyladenine DNA glycosylase AlkD
MQHPLLENRMSVEKAKALLMLHSDAVRAEAKRRFFKNCEGDTFLGVTAPQVREVTKECFALELEEIAMLWSSSVHEERSLAAVLLCRQYKKGSDEQKQKIFDFYVENRQHIRDWNGVDDSAPYIVGPHLLHREKGLLYEWAESRVIWDRRIAIVATWWFIRKGQIADTLRIAKVLLEDREDLIHKAVGWMLREAGKRDGAVLRRFLDKHHSTMPRTMLRYAIEKFGADERKDYLTRGKR